MPGAFSVRIRPAADADLDEAIDYLLAERAPSAADLLDAFEQAIEQLRAFPRTGSARLGQWVGLPSLRSLPLHGFPYLLFYVERQDYVEIVRLLHSSRDVPSILLDEPPLPD